MKRIIITMNLMLAMMALGQASFKNGSEVRLSPRLLNYQGFITDTLSNPITNPTISMTFAIFDAASSGNQKWTETQAAVSVDKGIFYVLLGSVTPIPDSVFTKSPDRWLEIQVGLTALSPRTRIVSSPYSLTATLSDTALYAKNSAPDNDWTYRVTDGGDTTLQTGGRWGLARFGNYLIGNNDSTHVNFGVACTTGITLQAFKYCAVLGGYHNKACRTAATVAGGQNNNAVDYFAVVSGGNDNTAASSNAVVAGGASNAAVNFHSTVSGGYADTASGDKATVAGGYRNKASGSYSIVSGGQYNIASGAMTTVSGGNNNLASETLSTVGGGSYNTASGYMATVGGGNANTASGRYATLAGGYHSSAEAVYGGVLSGVSNDAGDSLIDTAAVVAGGASNAVAAPYGSIGGGAGNYVQSYSARVGGGWNNSVNDSFAYVGAGQDNNAAGKYSAILGGYGNTIFVTGDYSYLFGINSDLYSDSTFMIDMPHVWFGTEVSGYEFPRSRGANGQVMITNGAGILSWSGITYVDSSRISANSHKLQGKDTTSLDARWVNEGQAAGGDLTGTYPNPTIANNAVNSDKIQDGSVASLDIRDTTIAAVKIKDGAVTMAKINQAGAATGQVVKWNGTAWQPASDSFRDNDWTFSISDGADTSLQIGGRWGLTRPGNGMLGNTDSTHVNFGFACTTGNNSMNRKYITISGGYSNWAYGDYASIGGGRDNWAMTYGTVAGGVCDTAGNTYATVGGGYANVADGASSVIAGGEYNMASGAVSIIGGGDHNLADSNNAVICGGTYNAAHGSSSTVGGGGNNTANRRASTVGGGASNTAASAYSIVGGGFQNTASNEYATVGGGTGDTASGYYSTVAGGQHNVASDYWTAVGGGGQNYAGQRYATVAGGYRDTVTDYYSFATNYHTKVAFQSSAAFTTSHATADNQVRAAAFSTGTLDIAMDHPKDPMNKILNQYGVASDEVMLIYSGAVVLDASGRSQAVLPDYFDDIARNPRIQLTGVGSADVVYVAEDVRGNSFVVGGKPGMKVYWTVNAERKDIHAEIARIKTPIVQEKTNGLQNHSIDDDAMIGIYDKLSQKNPELFRFKTEEGRQANAQAKTP